MPYFFIFFTVSWNYCFAATSSSSSSSRSQLGPSRRSTMAMSPEVSRNRSSVVAGRTIHLIGPHLTSSETGLSPHRTLCHPIGMLLNRDVYDTCVPVPQPQCIINDDRVVLSPIDAVIADVTGAPVAIHEVMLLVRRSVYGITIHT